MGMVWVRCLSVRQPYANLIAQGRKTIEVRTWEPQMMRSGDPPGDFVFVPAGIDRAHLLIVSSKRPKIEPAGYAVATCEVGIALPFECLSAEDIERACLPPHYFRSKEEKRRSYGWPLAFVVRLFEPFPVRGRLGIWWELVDGDKLRGAFADAWRRAPAGLEEPKP